MSRTRGSAALFVILLCGSSTAAGEEKFRFVPKSSFLAVVIQPAALLGVPSLVKKPELERGLQKLKKEFGCDVRDIRSVSQFYFEGNYTDEIGCACLYEFTKPVAELVMSAELAKLRGPDAYGDVEQVTYRKFKTYRIAHCRAECFCLVDDRTLISMHQSLQSAPPGQKGPSVVLAEKQDIDLVLSSQDDEETPLKERLNASPIEAPLRLAVLGNGLQEKLRKRLYLRAPFPNCNPLLLEGVAESLTRSERVRSAYLFVSLEPKLTVVATLEAPDAATAKELTASINKGIERQKQVFMKKELLLKNQREDLTARGVANSDEIMASYAFEIELGQEFLPLVTVSQDDQFIELSLDHELKPQRLGMLLESVYVYFIRQD